MSDHSDEKETTAAAVAATKDAQLPWTEAEERVMKRKVDLRVSRRSPLGWAEGLPPSPLFTVCNSVG